jgi:hypothetical protein
VIVKRTRRRLGNRFKGLPKDALAELVLPHGLDTLAELRVGRHEYAVRVLAAGIVSQDLRGELHGGRAVAVAPSHIRKSPQHQEIRAAQALTLDKD